MSGILADPLASPLTDIESPASEATPTSVTREILRGRLVTRTITKASRDAIRDRLLERVVAIVREGELGRVQRGPIDLVLSQQPITVRTVDLSFTSFRTDTSTETAHPDLVVEIVDGPRDDEYLMAKIDDLLSAGVREVWVVDGVRRAVEVHRRGSPPRVSQAGTATSEVRSPLLGGRPVILESLL